MSGGENIKLNIAEHNHAGHLGQHKNIYITQENTLKYSKTFSVGSYGRLRQQNE